MICRTIGEVRVAAAADAATDPPLTQDTADYVAAIRAACQDGRDAA